MSEISFDGLESYVNMLADRFGQKDKAGQYRNWFRDNGKLFDNVNESLSRSLANKFECEIKQCYLNCVKAVMFDYSENYRYFEGYMLSHGIPIEHAWIVKDYPTEMNIPEMVIDITIGIGFDLKSKIAKRKYDLTLDPKNDNFPVEYFGVEIPKDKLNEIVMRDNGSVDRLSFKYWESLQ
jgi:hypothetical protein